MIEGETFYVYVLKRPGAEEFLEEMHKLFEIVIYTASLSIYADPLLDELDPNKYSGHRLFREHCTFINNAFVKDLSQLGRDLKDVIIVDNSPASYALQPENAMPILTWLDDLADNKLYQLAPVLELLSKVDDVRPYLRKIVKDDKINYLHAFKVLRAEEEIHPRGHSASPDKSPDKNLMVDGWVSSRERVEEHPKKLLSNKKEEPSAKVVFSSVKPLVLSQPTFQSYIPASEATDNAPALRKPVALDASNPSRFSSQKPKANVPYVANAEVELILKKLESEKIEKTPKRPASSAAPSIPKPVSISDAESSGQKKALPPHHQPRQTPKAKSDASIRPSTPQTGLTKSTTRVADISGKKISQGKSSTFYSNLIKVKTDAKALLVKADKKILEKITVKPAVPNTNAQVPISGSSSNKKPNKHSSSMGNTDWIAGYDKLRKELGFNSPRDIQHVIRTTSGSVKPKESHMLVLSEKSIKKQQIDYTTRPLLKPSKAVQCLTPRMEAAAAPERKTTCAKYTTGEMLKFRSSGEVVSGKAMIGSVIPLEKNKFTQMLLQMNDGKNSSLVSSVTLKPGSSRRPVIASHNNFG